MPKLKSWPPTSKRMNSIVSEIRFNPRAKTGFTRVTIEADNAEFYKLKSQELIQMGTRESLIQAAQLVVLLVAKQDIDKEERSKKRRELSNDTSPM